MQKEGDQRILFADVATKVNRNRKSQERFNPALQPRPSRWLCPSL